MSDRMTDIDNVGDQLKAALTQLQETADNLYLKYGFRVFSLVMEEPTPGKETVSAWSTNLNSTSEMRMILGRFVAGFREPTDN